MPVVTTKPAFPSFNLSPVIAPVDSREINAYSLLLLPLSPPFPLKTYYSYDSSAQIYTHVHTIPSIQPRTFEHLLSNRLNFYFSRKKGESRLKLIGRSSISREIFAYRNGASYFGLIENNNNCLSYARERNFPRNHQFYEMLTRGAGFDIFAPLKSGYRPYRPIKRTPSRRLY